jgi:hypothetical protein
LSWLGTPRVGHIERQRENRPNILQQLKLNGQDGGVKLRASVELALATADVELFYLLAYGPPGGLELVALRAKAPVATPLQDVVELFLELVWAAWPLAFFSRENWRFVEAALIR